MINSLMHRNAKLLLLLFLLSIPLVWISCEHSFAQEAEGQVASKSLIKVDLITSFDNIYPAGDGYVLGIARSKKKAFLIELATGLQRSDLQLTGIPTAVAVRSDSDTINLAIITHLESGEQQLETIGIVSNKLKRTSLVPSQLLTELRQAALSIAQEKGGNDVVLVWDESRTKGRPGILKIEGTNVRKIFDKSQVTRLINVGYGNVVLTLQPADESASLIDIGDETNKETVFVSGLQFRNPERFKSYSPVNGVVGYNGVVIANGDSGFLTVLPTIAGSLSPRISAPIQIPFKTPSNISRNELLLAADRNLSDILLGTVGGDNISVFRRIGGGLEAGEPIHLNIKIKDMAVLSGDSVSDTETFVFLRDDGLQLLLARSFSDLQDIQDKGPPSFDNDTSVVQDKDPRFNLDNIQQHDSVTRVQRTLAALGYRVGPIDGKNGRSTIAAIRSFQFDNGIEVSGIIEEDTIKSLNENSRKVGFDNPEFAVEVEEYRKFLGKSVPGVRAARLLFLGQSHIDPDSRCFGMNSIPPRKLWPNSVAFARILKRLENDFEIKVEIASGYRNLTYGRCASRGDEDGTHLNFQGFDLRVVGETNLAAGRRALLKALKEMRDKGEFKGGLGGTQRSAHVDTRGENKDIGSF